MQTVQNKTIATLKQPHGAYSSGTLMVVKRDERNPEFFFCWASFWKRTDETFVGIVHKSNLQ